MRDVISSLDGFPKKWPLRDEARKLIDQIERAVE